MASAEAPCKHPSPYRMSSLEPEDCKGVQVEPERVEVSVHPLPERIHPVPSRQIRERCGACQVRRTGDTEGASGDNIIRIGRVDVVVIVRSCLI